MSRRWGATRAVALGVVLGLGAVACAHTDVPEDLTGPTSSTTSTPPTTTAAPAGCSDRKGDADWVGRSLRPNGLNVTGYVKEIRDRQFLRVGVDTSTRLFSSVNLATGKFEGFDVEIARRVSEALFGDAKPEHLRLIAIPYSERVDVLEGDGNGSDQVDMVIDTFTINCRRDQDIDFSSQYFESSQKLLVPNSMRSDTTIQSLNNSTKVCAPFGSTSIANLKDSSIVGDDPPEVVGVNTQADCLVKLQQGEVGALSGDDTVLAGFADQDPNVRIVGNGFSEEPYGIGLPPGHEEWVRYVNQVLENIRADGTWTDLYNTYLADSLGRGRDVQPPAAQYRD